MKTLFSTTTATEDIDMTVKALIAELQAMPQDREVVVYDAVENSENEIINIYPDGDGKVRIEPDFEVLCLAPSEL